MNKWLDIPLYVVSLAERVYFDKLKLGIAYALALEAFSSRGVDFDGTKFIYRLPPVERAELDRLYEEMNKRIKEDGGVWPEYTGPGK